MSKEQVKTRVEGGILEGFGKLFPDNTRLLVYPELDEDGELSDYTTVKVADNLRFLYRHLLANNFIFGIDNSDRELFKIYSRDLLSQLPGGKGEWESAVPEGVAEQIVSKKMFGYRG